MAHVDFSCCSSPAADVIAHALANQVNHKDIQSIIQCQKQVLGRLEKTNEMLINCNALSATRFAVASQDLKKHTQLLFDLKKDLDSVFKRIRFLKMKLSQQYTAAFTACNTVFYAVDEEDEPEERHPPSRGQPEKPADTAGKQKHVCAQLEDTHSGSSPQSSATSYNSENS
ncbi:kxDL motif-containing protein CG10681 [Dermacentor variabilis]|uniref:kxDL motif-containing protein CG10681 n=1 Tax=Dermacentor variabilis TaxID=34621 RepID=UPI003F5C6549